MVFKGLNSYGYYCSIHLFVVEVFVLLFYCVIVSFIYLEFGLIYRARLLPQFFSLV